MKREKCSVEGCDYYRRSEWCPYCVPHYVRHLRGRPMGAPIRPKNLRRNRAVIQAHYRRQLEAKG